MNNKTESEKLFEQYLDSAGFAGKWTYEPLIDGKVKRPDYLLYWERCECFFEVKEPRKKPAEPTKWPAHIDPYSSLRAEIDEARRKFKEFKEYPCSLVVCCIDDAQGRVLDAEHVLGAMLGNLGITADYDREKAEVNAGSERSAFLGGGKMVNPKSGRPQNTTISAVIALEQFLDNIEIQRALAEEVKRHGKELSGAEIMGLRMKLYASHPVELVPRMVVVENPFARIALPADLFMGPFDERWRLRQGQVEKVFAGKKLLEWEAVHGGWLANNHV
jgi:hypothetical protein